MDFIVIQGDIADQYADALVSPDDSQLSMSGGASHALCQAAGEELHKATDELTPDPGDVAVTDAFELHADYVIHAVTLGWGNQSAETILRDATRNALQVADERDCHSIVLPALGAGVGYMSTKQAARYMTEEIDAFEPTALTDVRIIGHTSRSRWEITEVADAVRYSRS